MLNEKMSNYRVRRWVLTILICLVATVSWSQESQLLTGYVIDEETGDPVPYASVGVPEQHRGISANINGYFQLMLPAINQEHHLQISSIGYQRISIPFTEIQWDNEQRFALKPEPTVLDEIVIVGESQTLEELVKGASKNRKVYLRSSPYLMNGFYREVLRTDQQYLGLTEAQGILYMNGYNSGYKNNGQHLTYDLAQWKNIRRSDYPNEQRKYLEIAALLKAKDYYLHDGPLHRKHLEKFNYTVTDSSLYQDRLVLIIDFEPKEAFSKIVPYSGKMFIKEDDQALIRLEVRASGQEIFLRTNGSESDIYSQFEISFLRFEDQYYLQRARYSRSYTDGNGPKNLKMELIGESFSNQGATFLNYNQRLVLYSEMLNPIVYYDADFWGSFSFSQGEDFKKMSEEDQTLDQQFEKNNNLRLTPLPEGMNSYEQMANDRNALNFLMQR